MKYDVKNCKYFNFDVSYWEFSVNFYRELLAIKNLKK